MSDRLNHLLDELTALVLTWERRALADSLPKCDPDSTLYVEQKAWSRARQNDAMELTRLIAEFRRPAAEEKHKAWKGW
jgi:hypothetical protein